MLLSAMFLISWSSLPSSDSCLTLSISSGNASCIQSILFLKTHPRFFTSGIAIIGCTEFLHICHICNQIGSLGMIQLDLLAGKCRSQICYFKFSLKLLVKFLWSNIVDNCHFCTMYKANKFFQLVKEISVSCLAGT